MIRRLPVIVALLVAIGALVALVIAQQRQQERRSGRFDVVFDDARGLLAGDQVDVAGAPAGEITGLKLTAGNKALVRATIARRFLPLRADASCSITSEGLISEASLACDPGTRSAAVLGGRTPTIPVSHTSEPVQLTDLFDIFDLPVRERVSVLLDELGISTAAEGENLNAIIARANPALADARQAIALLTRQQGQLGALLDSTNTVLAGAANDRGALAHLITGTATLTALTADHRSPLSRAVAELPGLLTQAEPALSDLDGFAQGASPVVAQLHTATPQITTLLDRVAPVLSVAAPALRSLGGTLAAAIPAARTTSPALGTISHYINQSLPSARQIAEVLVNLQSRGFVEDFLGLVYYLAALNGRYDATGHVGAAYFMNPNGGACDVLASTPVPGCRADYSSAGTASSASDRVGGRHRTAAPSRTTAVTPTSASPASTTATATTTPTSTAPARSLLGPTVSTVASGVSTTAQQTSGALAGLLHYLLK